MLDPSVALIPPCTAADLTWKVELARAVSRETKA